MKMTVLAIEAIDITGTSKKGLPYHINETRLTVSLPFDKDTGFGIKVHEYVFGTSENFDKFKVFRNKLPAEFDITLATQLNQYGQPVTVVTDVQPIKAGV